MEKAKSYLKEWIINFIKSRDTIFKKLVSIEDKENAEILVKYKEKEQHILVYPIVDNINDIISNLDENNHYGLIIFNTKNNFNTILENWDKLIKYRFLTIYFVNPYSELDKKWIVMPYTHNKICDDSSLKTGLKSMFDMVDPLAEKEIEVKFK